MHIKQLGDAVVLSIHFDAAEVAHESCTAAHRAALAEIEARFFVAPLRDMSAVREPPDHTAAQAPGGLAADNAAAAQGAAAADGGAAGVAQDASADEVSADENADRAGPSGLGSAIGRAPAHNAAAPAARRTGTAAAAAAALQSQQVQAAFAALDAAALDASGPHVADVAAAIAVPYQRRGRSASQAAADALQTVLAPADGGVVSAPESVSKAAAAAARSALASGRAQAPEGSNKRKQEAPRSGSKKRHKPLDI